MGRYESVEEYINSIVSVSAEIYKFGTDIGTKEKIVCIYNCFINGKYVDHLWVKDKQLLAFKHGDTIVFRARLKLRKRPSISIFKDSIKDIQLVDITNVKKG